MTEKDDFKKIPIGEAIKSSTPQQPDDNELSSGQKEALLFNLGLSETDLRRQSVKNEHDRTEKFRNAFEKIAISALYLFSLIIAALLLAWIWHLIAPAKCHWLESEQLSKIQTLATGGIVISIAAGHVKKRLGQ